MFFFRNYKVHYVVKIHKIDIVNKLWFFDNKLIISPVNSQHLVSVLYINESICCFTVIYMGIVYEHKGLLIRLILSCPVIILTNFEQIV
jgi:hypothetical protein